NPAIAIGGSFIFGLLYLLPRFVKGIDFTMMNVFGLFPYLFTILVLVITSILGKRNVQAPGALGQAYFREDR
ncbi:MAG: ABC transporter permease, partial [Candidatus Enteromonas sp.]|nr:ABC transporter permease [Candidatus Enteromonas sp.]